MALAGQQTPMRNPLKPLLRASATRRTITAPVDQRGNMCPFSKLLAVPMLGLQHLGQVSSPRYVKAEAVARC